MEIIVVAGVFSLVLVLGAFFVGFPMAKGTMDTTDNSMLSNAVIPLIDVSAPGKTVTATFSLG